jgi:hypothetical protein
MVHGGDRQMDDYWAASARAHWAAVADLERVVAAQPGDAEARTRLGHALYAALLASLTVTRDQTVEIASARQALLAEQIGRRILELDVTDPALRFDAASLLDRVAAGNEWTWQNRGTATVIAVLAVAAGEATAVIGGITDNLILLIAGALLSSLLLAGIILRYRRQHWRLTADRIAPVIWHPGI